MPTSMTRPRVKLLREYYQGFSRYTPNRSQEAGQTGRPKTAWVTAFTPIEILEALDIRYVYPESYAAVIAASGGEQELLASSGHLCRDCCSYSCCFEGCLTVGKAPRGMPPAPDVLIATNNQCNTLPGWWSMMAEKYGVPLIVLDYPGEAGGPEASTYVAAQHQVLIQQMEALSGKRLDQDRLMGLLQRSANSVDAWNQVVELFARKNIPPNMLFDDMSFLITSRCKPETAEFYTLMAQELSGKPDADPAIPALFWLGYPLWYHPKRYSGELLSGVRISGSNYITWWSLDYSGSSPMEKLFHAYNYTFLNLTQRTKTERLTACIRRSGAVGAVALHNRSCKCDFVSAKDIDIPQAEIEIDMIDREFLDIDRARRQIQTLLETVSCK